MTTDVKKKGRKSKGKTNDVSQRTLFDHFSRTNSSRSADGVSTSAEEPADRGDSSPAQHTASSTPSSPSPPAAEHMDTTPDDQQTSPMIRDPPGVPKASERERGPQPKLYPLFEPRGREPQVKSNQSNGHSEPPAALPSAREHDLHLRPSLSLATGPAFPTGPPPSTLLDLTIDDEPGSSQLDPIVVDHSPVRPTVRRGTASRSPSIQLVDLTPLTPLLSAPPFPAKRRRKRTHSPHVPLPDATSQHVRGPQSEFSASDCPFRARHRRGPSLSPPGDPPFSWQTLLGPTALGPPESLPPLVAAAAGAAGSRSDYPSVERYPAVARFHDADADASVPVDDDGHQQTWAEKWRPRKAEQVLDNEWAACYLRDWMHALRLRYSSSSAPQPSSSSAAKGVSRSGSQRKNGPPRKSGSLRKTESQSRVSARKRKARDGPTILREVKRPRRPKAGTLNGFIVDEDDGATDDEDGSRASSSYLGSDFGDTTVTVDPCAPPADAAPVPDTPFVFERTIGNTMLLAGPPGSGKTAAVYACAEELGWSVFEVYPGIGRRSGAHLDSLIGDVGKNHTLAPVGQHHQQQHHDHRQRDAFALLGSKTQPRVRVSDGGDEDGEESKRTEPDGQEQEQAPIQSVVLLEEVDVLFADDAGFWSAVVAFIRQCRRPVVLTCNDVTLVPTQDLPLEGIVRFRQPSAELARAVVARVCAAEGRCRQDVGPEEEGQGKGKEEEEEEGEEEECERAARGRARLDLRQELHQSQFGLRCSAADDERMAREDGHPDADHVWTRSGGWAPATAPSASVIGTDSSQDADADENREERRLEEALRDMARLAAAGGAADVLASTAARAVVYDVEDDGEEKDEEMGMRAVRELAELGGPGPGRAVAATEAFPGVRTVLEAGRESETGAEDFLARLADVLAEQVPEERLALDRRTVVLDYGPWVRAMAEEEEREEEERKRGPGTGRATANSGGRRRAAGGGGHGWAGLRRTALGVK